MIGARVPISLVDRLDKWAKQHDKTRAAAIVEAIRRLVSDK